MSEASREPQNIYDDPGFFAGYSTLERFGTGWERAAEHDDLLALLPDADGRRVLDLGCGAGQLAHHLATTGAAEVVGVDVSERMLALAQAGWAHPRVTYRREAIEEVAFSPGRFDLIVSSLVLHYVDDYAGLIRRIAGWLAPGGVLVYSTEPPIFTARLPGDGWVLDDAVPSGSWGGQRPGLGGYVTGTGARVGARRRRALMLPILSPGHAVSRYSARACGRSVRSRRFWRPSAPTIAVRS